MVTKITMITTFELVQQNQAIYQKQKSQEGLTLTKELTLACHHVLNFIYN